MRISIGKIQKIGFAYSTPLPLNLEGGFLLLFLYNSLMNILQTIFNDHYEEMLYILHPRQAVIADLTQWQATGLSQESYLYADLF